MVRVYVRHHVKDYETWRRAYDSYSEKRRLGRVLAWGIYCGVDDPNDVTVWQEFEDAQAAKAYAEGPQVGDAMNSGGVDSEPQRWYTQEAGSWSHEANS